MPVFFEILCDPFFSPVWLKVSLELLYILLYLFTSCRWFKGTVSGVFSSGYFHESSSHKSLKITLRSFQIFAKILGDIRKLRWTTGINETAAYFATRTTGLLDTGGKLATQCQRFWQKICRGVNDAEANIGTISDWLHLKWILRKKIIYLFTQYPRRKIFSICHRCQRHWWWTLSCK